MTSSVGAGGSAAADAMRASAWEGLLSDSGDSARKSSSDLRPSQSYDRSLGEEVGLGFFSGKSKSSFSEENLINGMKFYFFFVW